MSDHDQTGYGDWASAGRLAGKGLVSIVMPAHNLGASIYKNIRVVNDLFSGKIPFEIVVVDDGSTDNTRTEIEKTAALLPSIRPVILPHNTGKGGALKRGFDASKGSFVIFLDADLDIPPNQIARFFEIMENQKSDVVIGCKLHPESAVGAYPWHRKLASSVYYWLVKILIGLPLRDTQTGLKLFRREVLDWSFPRMLVKRFAFDLELLALAHDKGYRIAESPVELTYQGKWAPHNPRSVKEILLDTAAIFYRLKILHYYQTIRETRIPAPLPLVSIVVAYPGPTKVLDECVQGIKNQVYSNYEVILLPDEQSSIKWPERFREIPTGRIRPAEKRNIGIREARGDIIAFIDDDAFPFETWLSQAVMYFSNANVAGVGGPGITPSSDSYMAMISGRIYANKLVSGDYRYRYVATMVRDVEDFPSCNLFVRSSTLKQLGGFRTDFWPGEDTYLCMDITRKLGKEIVYDPRVMVFHHRRELFLPHLRQISRYALHRGYFARKFPSTSRKLSYMIPSLFVAGLIAGGVLSMFNPVLRLIYLSVLGFYAVMTLAASASLNPLTWLLTWVGIFLTHVVYGTGFVIGFYDGETARGSSEL